MRMASVGDILLYKSMGRSWFTSRLIAATSHAAGEDSKRGKYCHVAMVGWPYAGIKDTNLELLEMSWPRARRTKLDLRELERHYDIECWRVKADQDDMFQAIAWARQNLGMSYDLGVLLFGLFDDKHKEVCSSYIYKAWKAAGVNLYPNGDRERIVSPSELATSHLMERIW